MHSNDYFIEKKIFFPTKKLYFHFSMISKIIGFKKKIFFGAAKVKLSKYYAKAILYFQAVRMALKFQNIVRTF